jgi:hypothetical protein
MLVAELGMLCIAFHRLMNFLVLREMLFRRETSEINFTHFSGLCFIICDRNMYHDPMGRELI